MSGPDDRELDALVAEKVMGWKRCGVNEWIKPLHVPSKDRPGTIYDDWDAKGPHERLVPPECDVEEQRDKAVFFCGCESRGSIPYFSSNMDQAWDVALKLQKGGHIFDVGTEYHEWVAIVDGNRKFMAKDISAPRAICLAALRARGVEVMP